MPLTTQILLLGVIDAETPGFIYDERGTRNRMCLVGEQGVWEDGAKERTVTGSVGDPAAIRAVLKIDGWNDYVIIAEGNHLIHKINGMTTIDVTDEQPDKRAMSGLLALQLHAGPPMTVQFKDIRIKSLKKTAALPRVSVRLVAAAANGLGEQEVVGAEVQERLVGGAVLVGQRSAVRQEDGCGDRPALVAGDHDVAQAAREQLLEAQDEVLGLDRHGLAPARPGVQGIELAQRGAVGLRCRDDALPPGLGDPAAHLRLRRAREHGVGIVLEREPVHEELVDDVRTGDVLHPPAHLDVHARAAVRVR